MKKQPAKIVREVNSHYRIFERTEEGHLNDVVVGYDGDMPFRWERFSSPEAARLAIAEDDRITERDLLVVVHVVSVTTRFVHE